MAIFTAIIKDSHMKQALGALLIPLLLASCSQKENKQKPSFEVGNAPAAKGHYTVFEPLDKSVEKVGEVVFEKDTIAVFKEYTDKVDFVMQITGPEGQDGSMNFRAMEVHLVNKRTSDTITLSRDSFEDFDYAKDHKQMVVQYVAIDAEINGAIIPLNVLLAKPDTDIGDSYSITLRHGKVAIEVLDEGEMGD